jgi:hypothetical protein
MTNDTERMPSAPGSSDFVAGAGQAVSALPGYDPLRFEPGRYEGKPRWLSRGDKKLLGKLLVALDERFWSFSNQQIEDVLQACSRVSPINCAWYEYEIAKLVCYRYADRVPRDSDTHPEGGDA